MTSEIFVIATGQWENLGDVVLRRYFLPVLRPLGTLHLFVEKAPAPFVAAIADPADKVYHLSRDWRRPLPAALRRRKAVFVANAGEILIHGRNLRYHLKCMLLACAVRLRGGTAVMAGVGIRARPSRWQRLAMRIALSPYQLVAWRDPGSRRMLGGGTEPVMPDWAFGEVAAGALADQADRDVLVVSLRVDRPRPSECWLRAVRAFADARGLRIVAVTQVRRDLERSAWLASALGGELFPWQEEDFVALERDLRALYRRAAVTLSDRLHVLIIAATEGSVPVCLAEFEEGKIGRHFEAIGYAGASEHVAGLPADEIAARLDAHLSRRPELRARVAEARAGVAAMAARVAALLG